MAELLPVRSASFLLDFASSSTATALCSVMSTPQVGDGERKEGRKEDLIEALVYEIPVYFEVSILFLCRE